MRQREQNKFHGKAEKQRKLSLKTNVDSEQKGSTKVLVSKMCQVIDAVVGYLQFTLGKRYAKMHRICQTIVMCVLKTIKR
jgi:hypothetical protein